MPDIIQKRSETNGHVAVETPLPNTGGIVAGFPPSPAGTEDSEPGSSTDIWEKVVRGIIYGLAFFLPVLFTPWTYEVLDFSKQMLLFVLTTAALITWLLRLLVVRSWRFVKTPLDLPILIYVVVYFLASIFSVDKVASFLGSYGSFTGNFFQVLFLVLFYYLVINNFQTVKQVKTLLKVFFGSSLLVVVYALLQFFGLYVVRLPMAKVGSFNTVGGLLMISLFAAFVVVMSLGLKSRSNFAVPAGRLWRTLAIIAGLIIVMAINFLYAWIALLVGVLVYMIFQLGLSKNFALKNMITPLVLLIVVVAFMVVQLVFPFVSVSNIFNFNLPLEVRLDYTTAMPVLKGVVTQRPVLGTGPGTFLYAFSKDRGQNFNYTPFWSVRFDKAPSEAAEALVGSGILGALSFEILSLIFLIYGFFFLFRKKSEDSWNLSLGLYSGFTVLWVAHWIFYFNTVMAFGYWLALAGFMAVAAITARENVKTAEFSFASSPRRTVSVVSLVSVGLVLVVVFLLFAFSVYAADVFYRRGIIKSNDPKQYDSAQSNFETAIRLNRFRPDYYLSYSEFLLLRVNQELTKDTKDRNLGLIQSWLSTSINTARAAVDLAPVNWTAWERLASLYTVARPLVAGVDQFIIDSLTRAVQNDDKNPILYTELGQVYRLASRSIDPSILGKGTDSDSDGLSDDQEKVLGCDPNNPDTLGDGILDGTKVLSGLSCSAPGALANDILTKYIKVDQQNLLKAEQNFQKAIDLKSDYGTAYYQLAQTYEQSGEYQKSADELVIALQHFPNDATLKFDLGRMYFNAGKIEDAQRQFADILRATPDDANARYSLALTYERLGDKQRALIEYRKVAAQNPDNQVLKQKVAELEQAAVKK
ncbi:hypothetical protein D4R52_02200 [bacterium]|nr:MAG: hypothetical protein D4R52_02200 [bacterium]